MPSKILTKSKCLREVSRYLNFSRNIKDGSYDLESVPKGDNRNEAVPRLILKLNLYFVLDTMIFLRF